MNCPCREPFEDKMKKSWRKIAWCLGASGPVLLCIVSDFVVKRILGLPDLSGAWLYYSLLAGIVVCALAVTFMQMSLLGKFGLLLLAAAAMIVEIIALGIFYFHKDGLSGIQ
jgi:hypothetical protein